MHAWTLFAYMCILVSVFCHHPSSHVHLSCHFHSQLSRKGHSTAEYHVFCFGCRIEWKSKFAKNIFETTKLNLNPKG